MKIVYGVLACILIVGAIGGSQLNLKQLAEGKGVPKDPAQRSGFIVGMFLPPVICGVAGIGLGYLAIKAKKTSKRKTAAKN